VQAEVEKAFKILQKQAVELTGSSRTDAGVHALQNFFHFDFDEALHPQFLYKLNAILPGDIVAERIQQVPDDAHCRFDAVRREYKYFIYRRKDPFLEDRAYYFPYKLDRGLMEAAAAELKRHTDFTSFSKKKTQVKTFHCEIRDSEWIEEDGCLVYRVKADRFLRGMVRALTATMLRLGRGKLTMDEFKEIIKGKDNTLSSFGVPPHGLFLISVEYPKSYLKH
jgi:tRNA pseudouridine38-40 synthase